MLQPQGTESGSVANNSDGTGRATEAESTANRALAEAQEKEAQTQVKKVTEPEGSSPTGADETATRGSQRPELGKEEQRGSAERSSAPRPLSACTIWMGSSTGPQESTPLEKLEEEDLMRRDGIAIVYNPLIPNDVAPGFDPMDVSTWLFSMEKKDSEKLLKVAEVSARMAPQFGTKTDIFRQTFGKDKAR